MDGYESGTPSWVDLMTTDADAARDFYAAVLGWDFTVGGEDVGFYSNAVLGGESVAGIMPIADGQQMPPAWTTYLATDDLDRTVALAGAADGQILLPPMDVEQGDVHVGRMAMAMDPTGAAFGIWEAGSHRGAGIVNEPGALSWNELVTTDAPAARGFYGQVFGWGYEQIGDGETFDYTTVMLGERAVAGIMQMGPDFPAGTPSHWMTYFAVADADAAVEAVVAAGGTVLSQPADSPYGRMARVLDPQGAAFTVIRLAVTEPV
jgi:predicted enzyme related to lactoylglutathione lyase